MRYLLIAALIFAINLAPAFAPPTWAVLVVLRLNWDLRLAPLVFVGAFAAAAGRWVLAIAFAKLAPRLPPRYVANVRSAGTLLIQDRRKSMGAIGLFLVSPLPSAQLFEAAGLMGVALRPLVAAFFVGRLITYTAYALGATAVQSTNFGEALLAGLRSPWGWALQVVCIGGIVLMGRIDWSRFQRR